MKNFITPAELSANLDNYILLDVRGYGDYKLSHIPGAFVIDMERDLSGPVCEHGGRHPLPDMDGFAKTLEVYGITKDSQIVVYDSWIFLCGRLWWMLKYLGISNVKVLAGGIERWVREGHPLTMEPTKVPTESSTLEYKINTSMTMTRDEVFLASKSQSLIIVDARAPERYSGAVEDTFDGMTGHVPTAINHFFGHLFTQEGPRNDEELRKEFKDILDSQSKAEQNNVAKKPIVSYCGSGVTACLTMLAMSEIGIESALYVGSSSDWVTYEGFPLTTGEEHI